MKVFKYWDHAEAVAEDSTGKKLLLRKWAGSNDSAAAAKSAAERAVRALQDMVRNGQVPDGGYLYSTRDVPEELVREINPRSAVTRNRMGCLILNTTEAFFADVDIRDPWLFARLFKGETRQKREDAAIAKLKQFTEMNPAVGARIYRTKAGLRYLFTHAPLAVNDDTLRWLAELDSDKLYITLCREQACFRARLTPKPYRTGMKDYRPNRFPRETADARAAFEGWRANYEGISNNFATCKFIGTAGRDAIHEALAGLVKEHDRATLSDSDLPLA